MGGVNFSVSPLFFLFGVYYALTGRIFIFIVYTLTAIVHELGHSIVAENRGYKLNNIVLMPFGAVVSGEDELSIKDETAIALAGPCVNLLLGALFVALWWVFPETYVYTDIVAEANFALAIVNFLPVFPLDGGRILYATLRKKLSEKTATAICRATGIALSVVLLSLFVFSIFHTFNLSLLFFALFSFFGTVTAKRENRYVKLFSGAERKNLKRGVPYKKQAVDGAISLKDLARILDTEAINEIVVFTGGEKKTVLEQEKILNILKNGDYKAKLAEYI